MRILFLTGSPARYMAPPQLAAEQIVAGPDWADARSPEGRCLSLRTPAGDYDLAAILDKVPGEQRPEAIVSLVDASWRNLPRNLAAFRGPRVLLMADTHHLDSPLLGMMRYLMAEPYDRVVLLYDRHHAPFFRAAGFANLFWFPGLTFPHDDATVRAARRTDATRQAQVAFVGQTGKHHPRRARLLAALAVARLPVAARPLPQREALGHYGASLLGFNASLNGDLNLRVFEILAAGAALITDRLAPEAGLARLLPADAGPAAYGSAAELVEHTRHLLAHPDEARAMGAAGARWFDGFFNEQARRAMFQRLLSDGVAPEPFAFEPAEVTRVFFGGDTDRLLQTALAYEQVQELHRTQEAVRVAPGAGVPPDVRALLGTLPRVEFVSAAEGEPDVAVCGCADVLHGPAPRAANVWCWDAPPERDAGLHTRLEGWGFRAPGEDVAFYRRAALPPPALPAASTRSWPVRRKIYITFGGEVYDGTTALQLLLAPRFGADEVRVYDDHWLMHEHREFVAQNRWLWEHHHQRGFGWYAWKPFLLLDALSRAEPGDVVLFTDADTFPIDDFSMLYERCARDGGIMLFKAGGNVRQRFTQGQWCKRDCFIVMGQDEERYRTAEAGVARFMLFQKGPWRPQQFLMEWLTYCVNPRATTFDPSVLGDEPAGFVEHRTEQAIMTNLAHKYGLRLYREACELGNAFPEDQELYPQLFSQMNPWGNKTAPCVGSRFRNIRHVA